jgi:oligopeptide transport system substrate-binding protein
MFKKGVETLAAALLLLAASLVDDAHAEQQVLVRGSGDNWQSLDPHINYSGKDSHILGDLYEGLVSVDAKGVPVPGAAESWTIDAAGLVYTFRLRDGLKWANGTPIIAQDFVNGMKRLLEPNTASYKAYYLISNVVVSGAGPFNSGDQKDFATVGIKALDHRTIEMKLDRPNPHALELLNFYVVVPLPPALASGEDFADPGKGFSNGAYMLKEVVPQSHILLVKNPNYWDAANVKIPAVKYLVTEDVNTELKLYQSGEVDVTNDVPVERLAKLRESTGENLRIAPIARTIFLSFNVKKSPLTDPKIREALTLAIDRKTLEERVMGAGDMPLTSYVPRVEADYPLLAPSDLSDNQEANLARAKALLAEAGYGPDKPLKVKFNCFSDGAWKRRAETIAVMWQQWLGVISAMYFQETQAHWDAFYNYEWEVYCDSLSGDYAGAEPFLLYRTASAGAGYPWENAEFEKHMETALSQTDMKSRNEALVRAEHVLLDDYVLAPLAGVTSRRLMSSRVQGWIDNPVDYHLSKYLSLAEQ